MRGEKQEGKGKELAREAGSILATQPRPGPQRGGLCGTERGPSLSSSRTEDPQDSRTGWGSNHLSRAALEGQWGRLGRRVHWGRVGLFILCGFGLGVLCYQDSLPITDVTASDPTSKMNGDRMLWQGPRTCHGQNSLDQN